MTASELFKAGRLAEAIEAQIQQVKGHPADNSRRLFLFELLAFAGELDRASKQIDAVRYDQAETDAAVDQYRRLIDAERKRREVFAAARKPMFFAPPPAHVEARLAAVAALRAGQGAEAARLVEEARAAAPELKGQLNGQPFTGLLDADDLLGPVLEVMAHGEYYWVPLEQVALVAAGDPQYPRDLLWLPARLEMTTEAAGDVFLPTTYPGSHDYVDEQGHSDESVKLGRMTDWRQTPEGLTRGAGAKLFLAGEDVAALVDWRELVIEHE